MEKSGLFKKIRRMMQDETRNEEEMDVKTDAEVGSEVQEETIKSEIDPVVELEIQLAEAKDKYLRLFAEFDNFKKRSVKEKLELMRTAGQDTINSFLPVFDDFDRAKKQADDESTEENFSEGVEMIYQKLQNVAKGLGLKSMESNGETFDPEIHEAITEIPAPTDEMKGKIIDTVEKGYILNDKIIRYAKVVVGK